MNRPRRQVRKHGTRLCGRRCLASGGVPIRGESKTRVRFGGSVAIPPFAWRLWVLEAGAQWSRVVLFTVSNSSGRGRPRLRPRSMGTASSEGLKLRLNGPHGRTQRVRRGQRADSAFSYRRRQERRRMPRSGCERAISGIWNHPARPNLRKVGGDRPGAPTPAMPRKPACGIPQNCPDNGCHRSCSAAWQGKPGSLISFTVSNHRERGQMAPGPGGPVTPQS